ncbi:MAG TPA: DUF2834 domain-containing protein [Pyrinomonadaceae bacterium]|jgi:hypothetical protein
MKLRHAFLILFVCGVISPYAYFVPWFLENGLDVKLFLGELFANRVSASFGMDITVSTVVLLVFAATETFRLKMPRPWLTLAIAFAGTLGAGVSSGFPLFLYLRQRFLDKDGLSGNTGDSRSARAQS